MTAEALSPLAALIPLGISPFLALGLFGAAAEYTDFLLPPSLTALSEPLVWGGLLVLALVLKGGRSFKLTKPLAEMAGTTESLVAFITIAMMFVGTGAAALPERMGAQQASVLGTAALTVAAVTGLVAVTMVRMGIDLLTWLSPIPLVDALLQLVKLVLTAMLVGLAIFAPTLAVGANLALLVATVFAARWLVRVARFVWAVILDRAIGTFSPAALVVDGRSVGPLPAWVVTSTSTFPRYTLTHVRWAPETGWTGRPPSGWTEDVVLGSSAEAAMTRALLGTTLATPRGRFFLTARWGNAVEQASASTGTPLTGGRATPVMQVKTI